MPMMSIDTKTPVSKSSGDLQATLAAKGAKSIGLDYEDGEPIGLTFVIVIQGNDYAFKLPANWRGVLAALSRDDKTPRRYCTDAQAKRIAWRILLWWTKAQLALIESGQSTLAEVFLPYALTSTGETMGQRVLASPQRLLLAMGDDHA